MVPGFWMNEQSGVLRPVVEKYLRGEPLTDAEVSLMRAYCLQWIELGDWRGGPEFDALSDRLASVRSQAQLEAWLDKAIDLGIDPL